MENEEKIDISESEITETLKGTESEKNALKSSTLTAETVDLSRSKLFIENIKSTLDILEEFKEKFLKEYTGLYNDGNGNKSILRANLYNYISFLIYGYYMDYSDIHHIGGKPYCNSSGETVGLKKYDHVALHKYIDSAFSSIKNNEKETERSKSKKTYSNVIDSLGDLVGSLQNIISFYEEYEPDSEQRESEESEVFKEDNISLIETYDRNENLSKDFNPSKILYNDTQYTDNPNDKEDNFLDGMFPPDPEDEPNEENSNKNRSRDEILGEIRSSISDFSKFAIEYSFKEDKDKSKVSESMENIVNLFIVKPEENFMKNLNIIANNDTKIEVIKNRIENLKTNIESLIEKEEIVKKSGLVRQIDILENECSNNDRELLKNRYKKIKNLINNFIKRDIKTIENMKITSTFIDNNNRHIFLKKYLEKKRKEIVSLCNSATIKLPRKISKIDRCILPKEVLEKKRKEIVDSYTSTIIKLRREISKIDKNLNYLDLNQIPEDYVSKENKTFLDNDIFEKCKEYEKGLYVEFKNVLLEEMDKIDLLLDNNIEDIIIKRLKRKREEIIKSYVDNDKKLLDDISDIDVIINCLEAGFYKDKNYRPTIIAILKDLEIENPEIKLLEQTKEEVELYYMKEDIIDRSFNYIETGFYKDEDDRLSIEEFLKELKEQEMKKYADELKSIYKLIKNKNEKYYEESKKRIEFLGEFFEGLGAASNTFTKLQGIFSDQQQQSQ